MLQVSHQLLSIIIIQVGISNHMPSNVCGEITYSSPNLNGVTVEVWEWISNFIPHFIMDVMEIKLIHERHHLCNLRAYSIIKHMA